MLTVSPQFHGQFAIKAIGDRVAYPGYTGAKLVTINLFNLIFGCVMMLYRLLWLYNIE
jgi:hypothetical protein